MPNGRKRANAMAMNGRFETRVFLTIPLYLLGPSAQSCSSLALTENVSARGARIVTKRYAAPGECWQLTALSGDLRLPVRVIYCEAASNGNFCIGLQLDRPVKEWWNGRVLNWSEQPPRPLRPSRVAMPPIA